MDNKLFAANIMSTHLITANKQTKFSELKKKFDDNSIHHMPVVDGDTLIGMISIKDIMQHTIMDPSRTEIENLRELDEKVTIESLMHTSVTAVSPDTPVREAAEILYMSKFECLPVCEDNRKLVGIITNRDFVRLTKEVFED